MALGNQIISLRYKRGVLQKELASFLNVSVGTISNYEQNIHSPDIYTLLRLADYFGVTTDFLLERTRQPYSNELLDKPVSAKCSMIQLMEMINEMTDDSQLALIEYVSFLSYKDALIR